MPNVHGYSGLGVTVILIFAQKFSLEKEQICEISRRGAPHSMNHSRVSRVKDTLRSVKMIFITQNLVDTKIMCTFAPKY